MKTKPAPDSILAPIVSANLRRLRLATELTQEQLATRAAMSTDHVRAIEQRKRDPSLTVIEQLAQAMGRDPLEMFRRVK